VDVQQARFNMVEQQVRTWEVLDQRVLSLIESAPRHLFVPPAYQSLAYADYAIPLEHGECLMPPRLEARALQALQLDEQDRVLEIGTGSGAFTYLLAALSGHVFSVELHEDLHAGAARRLRETDVVNVSLECADGAAGRAGSAPYDAIVLTGSVPVLPAAFTEQLSIGGRLFAIVGEAPTMQAQLIVRTAADQLATENLFETVFPPLRGIYRPQHFTL
jgi:protein-L-isoaspartate(D-aspartate) O-methyltransferase